MDFFSSLSNASLSFLSAVASQIMTDEVTLAWAMFPAAKTPKKTKSTCGKYRFIAFMGISPFVQVELWAMFIKEVGAVVSLALSDRPHLAGSRRLYSTASWRRPASPLAPKG